MGGTTLRLERDKLAFVSGMAILVLSIVFGAIILIGAPYVARDADARGHDGRLIGLAWLLSWPVGLVLWLSTRRAPRTRPPAS